MRPAMLGPMPLSLWASAPERTGSAQASSAAAAIRSLRASLAWLPAWRPPAWRRSSRPRYTLRDAIAVVAVVDGRGPRRTAARSGL